MTNKLNDKIQDLSQNVRESLEKISDLSSLDNLRIKILGKNGKLTILLKSLKNYEKNLKIDFGSKLNILKREFIDLIDKKKIELEQINLEKKLKSEKIDITLFSKNHDFGFLHPLSRTIDEVSAIFSAMDFKIVDGPDIETDYYNFTALNIPLDHPARQEHDTFYFHPDAKGERKVLRTHTSPVQIRVMEKINLSNFEEMRVIVPGRTYRSDHDATHSPMFHQCEGLVVGKNITMSQLKGTLVEFCRVFFNIDNLPVRFRPSYFPFTEPSAEVDIGCMKSSDGSLIIGEGKDWLEILGSGMVHPKVLAGLGIDPEIFQGFAFGMGLERLTMLKYGIPDLRPFYESDMNWLKHYGFLGIDNTSLHSGINGIYS